MPIGSNIHWKEWIANNISYAVALKKLDLLYSIVGTKDHFMLIQKCPNLEVLETKNVIGDWGLVVLGHCCKRLKRPRFEQDDDEHMSIRYEHLASCSVLQQIEIQFV